MSLATSISILPTAENAANAAEKGPGDFPQQSCAPSSLHLPQFYPHFDASSEAGFLLLTSDS